jgi:hypothetical protein
MRKPLSFFIYRHGRASNNDVGIKVGWGRFVLHGKDVCRLAPAIITVTSRGGLRIRRPRHCPKGWPDDSGARVTRRQRKVSA